MTPQPVTRKDSTIRLALYVIIAMATMASTNIDTLNMADAKAVFAFVLQTVVSGLIAARAYIDQTPSNAQP